MPRRASRLTLIITDVRIERLKTLSDADAVAEGIERAADVAGMPSWKHYPNGSPAGGWLSPRESYRTLWDGLNAKRGFGWDTNPWIIALTFRTVKANIDKLELAA